MTATAALIVAAGRGLRLGADMPKQYLALAGAPVLRRTIAPFVADERISMVRAVIDPADRDLFLAAVAGLPRVSWTAGGPTRQDSVRLGLESLAEDPPAQVLIHDGARPFVTTAILDRLFEALTRVPAAIAALPVVDTLKRAHRADPTRIEATVPREALWRAQTPQAFHFAPLLEAHRRFAGAGLTDDAAVFERAGLPVALVAGDEDNFKLTTRDDWRRGERLLAATSETRTGLGFDVHRFGPGDHVMLGGVKIGHEAGLEGHSDADVALHALTDAVLGAIGDGDIGSHFPPSDPRWQGASSSLFLKHAATLVQAKGGSIIHVDVTVICERPKIGPHREAMRASIAGILTLGIDRVSVKATTTERLGFTGRGEGIAAQALAAVRLPAAANSEMRPGLDPDPV